MSDSESKEELAMVELRVTVAEQNDYDPAFYRRKETPSERWQRMRRWASDNLAKLPGEE